jgi:hypothetical protein
MVLSCQIKSIAAPCEKLSRALKELSGQPNEHLVGYQLQSLNCWEILNEFRIDRASESFSNPKSKQIKPKIIENIHSSLKDLFLLLKDKDHVKILVFFLGNDHLWNIVYQECRDHPEVANEWATQTGILGSLSLALMEYWKSKRRPPKQEDQKHLECSKNLLKCLEIVIYVLYS